MAEPSKTPRKAVKAPAKKASFAAPKKSVAAGLVKVDAATHKAHQAHVERIHSAEILVDKLETDRTQLREEARQTLGVSAEGETVNFAGAIRDSGTGYYTLFALGMLSIADTFQAQAFTILSPEIARSLGISIGAIAGARTIAFLATILAPLPMARLAQSKPRRAALCVVTGIIWSVVTIFTGFVPGLLMLMLVLSVDGFSTGSVAAIHTPLLVDSYPPTVRARVISGYQMMTQVGAVLSPLFVSLIAGPLNLTWRGVFLVMGVTSTAITLLSIGLRDPGFGKFDTEKLRESVREAHDELPSADRSEKIVAADLSDDDVELGFFEIVRRVLLIPTVRRLCAGFLVFGILLIPFSTFLSFFLADRWNLSASGRGVFFAVSGSATVVVLALYAPRAEDLFRRDPAGVVNLSGWSLAFAITVIGLAVLAPQFWMVAVLFIIALGSIALLGPSLGLVMLSIVESRWRPHTAALTGIFTAAGSIIGILFLQGIDRRFGVGGAVFALVLPGVLGALIIRSARHTVVSDMDRMIDQVLEDEEIRQIEASGGRLPMLACRGIDFSYGQLQVLFDVNFTVDDGEMVALLGTNGAGKSTLLKVISGIGLPSQGSVRFRGQDITFLDAERRVMLGVTQIPGGRAVFGPMNVIENLRAFGYTFGTDRKRVEEEIERCLTAFPRLDERKGSLASTLSGGEQQMLGLSKALMLRPRLLLIDELSLGLAPVIVGQLLDMVREINNEGTAVVLVEQSVNIALSLVDHAYFMEKGEMRFDGTSEDLLGRGDLLRAVFLEGADAGTKEGAKA